MRQEGRVSEVDAFAGEMESVRERLSAALQLPEGSALVLTASGTCAEYANHSWPLMGMHGPSTGHSCATYSHSCATHGQHDSSLTAPARYGRYIPLTVAQQLYPGAPIHSVMAADGETGSGGPNACSAQYFNTKVPFLI